ncbi:MAG: Rieske (2Fe-2S) protein [Acidimicrobiales bacterium]|nr:Rieske (2Fe-2S) protein [Acidimicrobiales bacterium]
MSLLNAGAVSNTTSAKVADLSELAVGEMKLAKVGDRRIVLACTEAGISAFDNACPHQGYGLATGSLDGEVVTCQWHNWKFRVGDGRCLVGEEDVQSHPVSIEDGEVWVSVSEPTDEAKREQLWPSLERAVENDYRGQIARDVARLLTAGATADEIVSRAVAWRIGHNEWGMGHEMANATDCLVLSDLYQGLDKTLPVAHALAGLAEQTRGRPGTELPAPDHSVDFHSAVEGEDAAGAMAAVRAMLADASHDMLRTRFVESVGRHHLSYGHGAIYVQKAFELIDRCGWDQAEPLLTQLAATIVYMTREDTLPYMSKAMGAIAEVDLELLAGSAVGPDRGAGALELADFLIDAEQAPIGEAVDAALAGLGVEGVLDAVVLAVSRRLLRYDASVEFDHDSPFGWLDISHGLTYARAARWAWRNAPGPDAARLALFSVFLAFDTGRLERRTGIAQPVEPCSASDLVAAIANSDESSALGAASEMSIDELRDALAGVALGDMAGSFIVSAHLVKGAVAAWEEAHTVGSKLPLLAMVRLAAAPRRERFIARNAAEAIAFIQTGRPPQR